MNVISSPTVAAVSNAVSRVFDNPEVNLSAFHVLEHQNHAAARAGSEDEDLEPLISMFEKVVTLPSAHDNGWPSDEIQRLSIRPSNSQ